MALITQDYVWQQHELHKDPNYGAGSHRYAYLVAGIAMIEDCVTILDYGCGKGTLGAALRGAGFGTEEYDPGVPAKADRPQPADLVTCIDVMEHIEPGCFDAVINDLATLTHKLLFVDVATKIDKHRWLDGGRNAHLIVNEGAWWQNEFKKRNFELVRTWNTGLKAWIALMRPPQC